MSKNKIRKAGEGTIWFDKKEKAWRGKIKFEGQVKTFYAKTSELVQQKMFDFRIAKSTGLDVTKVSTVGEMADKFLAIKKNNVSQKVWNNYELTLRLHVLPELAHIKISELSTDRLNSWIIFMLDKGISTQVVNHAVAKLSQVLNHALKLNMISRNPASYVEKPKHIVKQINPYTKAELNEFLESAKDDSHYGLWFLLATTGLRVGEALALEWGDVDINARTINISKTFDDEVGVRPPKTASSNRTIIVSEKTIDILRAHQSKQLEQQLSLARYYKNNDLIFPSLLGTHLSRKNIYFRNYKKLSGAKDRTIHDLRHSFASLSLAEGIPVVDVSYFLGHRNPSTTLKVYSHYIVDTGKNPSEVVSDLLI